MLHVYVGYGRKHLSNIKQKPVKHQVYFTGSKQKIIFCDSYEITTNYKRNASKKCFKFN